MIVPAVQQPNFVRDARGIGAERVIIALHVYDALALLFVLPHDIAKNAALPVTEPFARRGQLVLDSARHKGRRRYLRVRVRPLVAGQRSLILEYGHVFETRVLLQIGDTRSPYP